MVGVTSHRDHDPDCGGCNNQGAHRRWCRAVVGFAAYRLGTQAQQAENLADSVGSNCPEAANALYAAAHILTERAHIRASEHKNRQTAP